MALIRRLDCHIFLLNTLIAFLYCLVGTLLVNYKYTSIPSYSYKFPKRAAHAKNLCCDQRELPCFLPSRVFSSNYLGRRVWGALVSLFPASNSFPHPSNLMISFLTFLFCLSCGCEPDSAWRQNVWYSVCWFTVHCLNLPILMIFGTTHFLRLSKTDLFA